MINFQRRIHVIINHYSRTIRFVPYRSIARGERSRPPPIWDVYVGGHEEKLVEHQILGANIKFRLTATPCSLYHRGYFREHDVLGKMIIALYCLKCTTNLRMLGEHQGRVCTVCSRGLCRNWYVKNRFITPFVVINLLQSVRNQVI